MEEIEKAFVERRPAEFYRAVRKINAKPKSTEHEEDGEHRGAVKKLDGSLTRGPQETEERWYEHFRDLFNQECPLVTYPENKAAAEYCGQCYVQTAYVCARGVHSNPGQDMTEEERRREREAGGRGEGEYVWIRDSDLWEGGDDEERKATREEEEDVEEDDPGGTMNHLPPEWALPQWRQVMPELANDFSKKEFDTARSQVGLDRAVSVVDGQPIEVINLAGGPQLLQRVQDLCNGALRCGICPPLWKDVAITVLYKQRKREPNGLQ